MNAKVKALRVADEPVAKLEQRRSELLAERDLCDTAISNLRAKRSDATIDGRFDDADRLDGELSAELGRRARIDDGLERIRERLDEARVARALQARVQHNAEVSRRIDALGPKCKAMEETLQKAGELGRELVADVEAIHRLGQGYLSGEDMVLTRLLAVMQSLVAIHIDRALNRECPIQFSTEGGRAEFFRCHAPAVLLAEARRRYLVQDPTPPKEAA